MSIYGNHFASVRPCTETVNLEEVFMQEMNQFDSIVNSLSILSENTEIIYEAKIDIEKIKTKIKELWGKFKAWVKETWQKIKSHFNKSNENEKSENEKENAEDAKYKYHFKYIYKDNILPYLGYIDKLKFAFEYTDLFNHDSRKSIDTSQERLNNIKNVNQRLLDDYDEIINSIPELSSSKYFRDGIFKSNRELNNKINLTTAKNLEEYEDQKIIFSKIKDIEIDYENKINSLEKYLNGVFVNNSINEWDQSRLSYLSLAISTDIKTLRDLLNKTNKLLFTITVHNFTIVNKEKNK